MFKTDREDATTDARARPSALPDLADATLVDPSTGRAPARYHRLVTVPALVVAFVVLVAHRYFLLTLVLFPQVIAMPWLAAAAARPTPRAIDRAHTAVRSTTHVMCAVGVLAVFGALPFLGTPWNFLPGAIICLVSAAILAVAGTEPREARLGVSLALIGAAQLGAMVLLIWFTPSAFALFPTGVLMILGGIAWGAEAEAAPAIESALPHAIVRC